MASREKTGRNALADCTNTPTTRPRPRRSCGAYCNDNKIQTSPARGQENLGSTHSNKRKSRLKQAAAQNDDENRTHFPAELPAQSSASNTPSDGLSTFPATPTELFEVEDPLRDDQNLRTPQAVLPAVYSSRFTEDSDESGFPDIRVYSKRRQTEGESAEKLSLSCPPLGRAALRSDTEKRGHKCRDHRSQIPKRRSMYVSTDFPESGKPKVQRRRNSMPERGGKHSLPEDFIREQRAHFAEIDAFELQEEDLSDAD
eukprot:Gb_06514 [translate_table: standard]